MAVRFRSPALVSVRKQPPWGLFSLRALKPRGPSGVEDFMGLLCHNNGLVFFVEFHNRHNQQALGPAQGRIY